MASMETSRSIQRDRIFRFGPFELSERDAELRKNGVRIKLQEQSFQVLTELVANAGRIVTREELQQKLWPADTFVDFDVGLNSIIRKLRQALNDDADDPHYIETLAKRGYRFLAQVTVATPDLAAVQDESPRDNASAKSAEPRHESMVASGPKPRSWYSVLAVSVAIAVLVYGSVVAWRGKATTPALATEQRITANPPEAPVTAAVISPDEKYVAYSDSTGLTSGTLTPAKPVRCSCPRGSTVFPQAGSPMARICC
jgi:DNA-binding winged helix-turn-helix (wHTH) protein